MLCGVEDEHALILFQWNIGKARSAIIRIRNPDATYSGVAVVIRRTPDAPNI